MAAFWGWVETKVPQPLVDMRVLRRRPVLMTNITAVLIGFSMFASFLLIPQLAQTPEPTGYGFGASVTGAGLLMLPSTLVMLVAGPLGGPDRARADSRLPLVLGAVVRRARVRLLRRRARRGVADRVGGVLLGIGIGFAFAAMANLVVESVPRDEVGVATGINTIMRSLGGALGAQLVATLLTTQTIGDPPIPTEAAYTDAFIVAAIAAGAGGGRRADDPRGPAPAAAVGHGASASVTARSACRRVVSKTGTGESSAPTSRSISVQPSRMPCAPRSASAPHDPAVLLARRVLDDADGTARRRSRRGRSCGRPRRARARRARALAQPADVEVLLHRVAGREQADAVQPVAATAAAVVSAMWTNGIVIASSISRRELVHRVRAQHEQLGAGGLERAAPRARAARPPRPSGPRAGAPRSRRSRRERSRQSAECRPPSRSATSWLTSR